MRSNLFGCAKRIAVLMNRVKQVELPRSRFQHRMNGWPVYCFAMPNSTTTLGEHRYQIQSVARAASLLHEIAAEGSTGLSITEVAERLGVAKSTALALARTLSTAGLLRSVEPGP